MEAYTKEGKRIINFELLIMLAQLLVAILSLLLTMLV